MPFTVLTAFGTRPEAIKLAPIIRVLERDPELRSRILVTAQHRDLLDQMLDTFEITPDVDLDLMRPGHTLAELTARVVEQVDGVLARETPDLMVVQGDTTTVFAASLAAFYRAIPVAHVEAGLRSFDLANPFPEEANRRLTSQLASLHLAPTRRAVRNLESEGVPADRIHLTGNSVVDALHWVLAQPNVPVPPLPWQVATASELCPVLVTLHRRESWGDPLAGICRALRRAADDVPKLNFVYPVHPQPRVQEAVQALLQGQPRITLCEPLDYPATAAALRACAFVVTDSGGLQEEAPSLGKPVLVLRTVTERPEGVEAGTSWLVGTREEDVYRAIVTLATDRARYDQMAHAASPFGDGLAAARTLAAIRRFAGLRVTSEPPPLA